MGRQVDRVRGERRQHSSQDTGDNNNMLGNNETEHEHKPDIYGELSYILTTFNIPIIEKSLLPSLSSNHSADDVSSLQVKGAATALINPTPEPSHAPQKEPPPYHKLDKTMQPTKPILKHRQPSGKTRICPPIGWI